MAISQIHLTKNFLQSFKNLPKKIQDLAKDRDAIFIQNPFDTRLRTHKLKGRLQAYWAYSVNYEYRILFRFVSEENVIYFNVGTHEIYK